MRKFELDLWVTRDFSRTCTHVVPGIFFTQIPSLVQPERFTRISVRAWECISPGLLRIIGAEQ